MKIKWGIVGKCLILRLVILHVINDAFLGQYGSQGRC